MKKYIYLKTIAVLLICTTLHISAQEELLSAKSLLQNLSKNFKTDIKDMEADIKWIQKNNTQEGTLLFKNPQKVRINFTEPEKQVICTNGYDLWLYVPYLNLVLNQNILEKEKRKNEEGQMEVIENPILINPVGYDKFLTNYAIEYHETKEKVKYKDDTMVYQLKLIRWRSSKNGFNVVYLIIEENGIIRRVEGITAAYRHIVLEIDNVTINKNISDLVFNYEPPPHATTVDDFITSQGEMN